MSTPLTINVPQIDASISSLRVISRCGCCAKKLGLTYFTCKCGGNYCAQHRADTLHNCSYDYQSEYKKSLSTSMVKIESKKIEVV